MNANPKPPTVKLRRPDELTSFTRAWNSRVVQLFREKVPWGEVVDALFATFLPAEAPAQTGWRLVYGSLLLAATKLRSEISHDRQIDTLSLEDIANRSDMPLNIDVIEVRHDFFERPDKFALLDEMRRVLLTYFQDQCSLDENRATELASDLQYWFVQCLIQFEHERPDEFRQVEKFLKNPWLRQQTFNKFYNETLCATVNRPLPESKVRLIDIYLPPRAFWISDRRPQQFCRQALDLEKSLNAWLQEFRPEDSRRVIAGGPGAGKSVFANRWLLRLAEEKPDLQTLLVPLNDFGSCDLAEEINAYVERLSLLCNPLELGPGEELLLILDGLDELNIEGRSCVENASALMQAAETLLNMNRAGRRLRLVILSREPLINAVPALELRRHQVLYMMGYLPVGTTKGWSGALELLQDDYRVEWWQKWWSVVGGPHHGVPSWLEEEPLLRELSDRPAFNFLIGGMLGSCAPNTQPPLNDVYHALVDQTWQRSWALDGRQRVNREFTADDFRRLLEMLGIVAWQRGDGKRVSRAWAAAVFDPPLEVGDWPDIVAAFDAAASKAPDLLLHFFFQRCLDGDGFELTHPSFTNYLAACALDRFIAAATMRGCRGDGGSREELLRAWARLTSPTRITDGIVTFLEGEIAALDGDELDERRRLLIDLFNDNLRDGNAHLHAAQGASPFRRLQQLDAAAELALLAAIGCHTKALIDRSGPVLDANAKALKQIRWQPAWPEVNRKVHAEATWDLLRRLQHGPDARQGTSPANHFCGMVLDGQILRADLAKGDLRYVSAVDADFGNANLNNADLAGADLSGASLVNADVALATLRGTLLWDAVLLGADLAVVELGQTIGLTWDQLNSAKRCDRDNLPRYLLAVEEEEEESGAA